MATRTLLLEIGTEEIPARFLPGALETLRQSINSELLIKENIPNADKVFSGMKTLGTPRRLAAMVSGLPDIQEDRVEEVFGPPRQAAYDKDGNPTKAAVGFAKSQGVEVSELQLKPKEGKGEYVVAIVREEGRPVADVLPEALRDVVLGLSFPKSMRWGNGEMRFVRPVHWIVAVFGDKEIHFEVEGIRSGRTSRGHRFLSPREFDVKDAADYLRGLGRRKVVVDPAKRMKLIKNQAEGLVRDIGAVPSLDDELSSILACLVEWPQCVLGDFEAEFLELPDELLTSVMVGHQKYIPVKDSAGKLINHFVIVSNTKTENADMVKAGAERVIRARFEDARFYFEDDRKTNLADRVEDLKKVTFQEKLGSTYEKTMRVQATAGAIADAICPDKKDKVLRAAYLSKADLISGVVFEFPELQGIMGMYYAANDGEDSEVQTAIRDQYHPAGVGDYVSGSDVSAVLGLADRIDNIAAFFGIGLVPTGSEDPFALRRQALGLIAILEDRGYEITIEGLLDIATENLSGVPGATDVRDEVLTFFGQRFEPLLSGKGFAYDVVQALMSLAVRMPIGELYKRLNALGEFKKHLEYNEFLIAIKRVRNILVPLLASGAEIPPVKEELLREDAERELFEAYKTVRGHGVVQGVLKSEKDSDISGALRGFTALIGPVNSFFDKVLVMDKDEAVKNNRLALLRDVWDMVSTVADFSKLQEIG